MQTCCVYWLTAPAALHILVHKQHVHAKYLTTRQHLDCFYSAFFPDTVNIQYGAHQLCCPAVGVSAPIAVLWVCTLCSGPSPTTASASQHLPTRQHCVCGMSCDSQAACSTGAEPVRLAKRLHHALHIKVSWYCRGIAVVKVMREHKSSHQRPCGHLPAL